MKAINLTKKAKLTKKAQDIVNQIMSADAVDIDHGRIGERISYGDTYLTGEGLECSVNVDGDIGKMIISNESLNCAVVSEGTIEIDAEHIKDNPYGDMTITLYKLSKINAV
jgi:hypothetical protein